MSNRRVDFKYRDAASFRTVRVNGVLGGSTPTGEIYMGIYTQRPLLPETSYLEIDENGRPGQEILPLTPQALIREIEVGLILDLPNALAIRTWLDGNIKALQHNIAQQQALASMLTGKKQ
jgi:hypothetical protein